MYNLCLFKILFGCIVTCINSSLIIFIRSSIYFLEYSNIDGFTHKQYQPHLLILSRLFFIISSAFGFGFSPAALPDGGEFPRLPRGHYGPGALRPDARPECARRHADLH